MKLRITGGSLKGRYIEFPESASDFRPTKEIVRESVANSLFGKIENSMVADICAGSGAFGFEMLSRGARCIYFIESNHIRVKHIRSYARLFNAQDKCRIYKSTINSFLKKNSSLYDIIYYDPPYTYPESAEIIPEVLTNLTEDGILIFEHERDIKNNSVKLYINGFNIKTKKLGKTELDFYTRNFSKKVLHERN